MKMIVEYKDLLLRKCNEKEVPLILELQEEIIAGLENKELLRRNTKEMFEHCVEEPHLTMGLYHQNKMIAVAIMVDEKGTNEDLSADLIKYKVERAANFKLILVKVEYRGNGLQRALMNVMEQYALACGYTHLCATVSEKNIYSRRNIRNAGYLFDHTAIKYGGLQREVYVKELEPSKKTGIRNKEEIIDIMMQGTDLATCVSGVV